MAMATGVCQSIRNPTPNSKPLWRLFFANRACSITEAIKGFSKGFNQLKNFEFRN